MVWFFYCVVFLYQACSHCVSYRTLVTSVLSGHKQHPQEQ